MVVSGSTFGAGFAAEAEACADNWGAGGNDGGGLCSRSITDFATSAAVRIGLGEEPAEALAGRRNFRAALAFFGAALGTAFLGVAFGVALGAALRTALGAARFAAAVFTGGVDGAPGRALFFSAPTFLGAGVKNVLRAASNFFLACLAAFFSTLNALRACLSRAFADLTTCLAEAARAAAFLTAAASSRTVAILFVRSVDAEAVAMVN